MLRGDRLALARLISLIENRSSELLPIMARVQQRSGNAHVIGVTGPPGSGKSTLVDQVITLYRQKGFKVGVVAIDPSSPFSGGAVLGDRIRMQDHAGDEGVFIRSLGSRGSRGGLSRATRDVVRLYGAFGMQKILVETVGVGQTELDIMEVADTTIVLLTPESGDTIQTMKAGILEIADLFVVNKADREGADRLQMELRSLVEIGGSDQGWDLPVLLAQASRGIGIRELVDLVEDHRTYLRSQQRKEGDQTFREETLEIVLDELRKKIKIGRVENPYQAASEILKEIPWPRLGVSTHRPRSSWPRSNRRPGKRSVRR